MSAPGARKSRLFLLELLIMILFFAIASGICVQIFAKASTTSQESKDLTHAVNLSQSVSALLEQEEFSGETLMKYWSTGTLEGNNFTASFNETWDESDVSVASYQLNVTFSETKQLQQADLTISSTETQADIYQLTIQKYQENLYEK